MRLKKGMCVRYRYYNEQKIGKIDFIKQYELLDDNFIGLTNDNGVLEGNILKASDNLIDLIEENDLLEIRYLIKSNEYQKEVLQVIKNSAGKLYVNAFSKKIFIEDFDRYGVEILSILAKEQFESQKYIVKSSVSK